MLRRRARLSAFVAVLGVGAVTVANLPAAALTPADAGIRAVGPVSPATGYPTHYTDATGLRLEGCLDGDEPLCNFAGDLVGQASFPDNFPDEFFYMASDAIIEPGNGVTAHLVLALEGAFAADVVRQGDQIVFGRVRTRVEGLQPGATYTVTHPYGVDTHEATDAARSINVTEDVGIAEGNFEAVKASRIGPFLQWVDDAGERQFVLDADGNRYIGDPAEPHVVTGSPFETNYFQIVGPAIGAGADAEFACDPLPPGTAAADCIQTDLFSLWGKEAVNSGVTPVAATLRSGPDGQSIDVFASSDAGEAIVVDVRVGTELRRYGLLDQDGRYAARIPLAAGEAAPDEVVVTNLSDTPAAVTRVAVRDHVAITSSTFGPDAGGAVALRVEATSSTGAELDLEGFDETWTDGVAVLPDVTVPPSSVTVTSAAGGTDTEAVELLTDAAEQQPVQAAVDGPSRVQPGQRVVLDGTGSQGVGDQADWTWEWTQVDGPAVTLSGAATPQVAFDVPADAAGSTITIQLRVTDSSGQTGATQVPVVVDAVTAPIAAVAQSAVQAQIGEVVTLDGSPSQNATAWSWSQTAGPAVTLSGADQPTATFTVPDTDEAMTFALTVSNLSGSAGPVEVTVTVQRDEVDVTRAEYRRGRDQLRMEGTTTITAGNSVSVSLTNQAGATATLPPLVIDPIDGWTFRGPVPADLRGPDGAAPTALTYSISTTAGGAATGTVQVR